MSFDKFKRNRAEEIKKIVDYFLELMKIAKTKNIKIAGDVLIPSSGGSDQFLGSAEP